MNKLTRRPANNRWASLLAASLLLGAPVASLQASEPPSIAETKAIAEEGYIYGLPIVMSYAVMYAYAVDKDSGQFKAPFNQINNEARVFTYKDTAVVTANSDTPYSSVWLDLRSEPIVLSVPEVEPGRYYSVQLEDINNYIYGYIGSRTTGNAAASYMVVGPDWQGETPPGITKVFRSSSQFSLVIYRTQLFNPADMPNVEKIQAGYNVQALSTFLGLAAPAPAPAINFPEINKELAKTGFFNYLKFVQQFAPANPNETAIRAKLANLGAMQLTPERKAAIAEGMKAGDGKIDQYIATGSTVVNGWAMNSYSGSGNFFNGNWLLRAAGAKAGIFGNAAIEAAYPLTRMDAAGEAVDTSKHNYTITFAAGQYPPVHAFWSVTMYDGKSQLLIKNPINRYLINSPMLPDMQKNPDGSLTLYIQKDSPGKDKESNWLPAPDATAYLVMRLYWPKTDAPSILPMGQGTWSPPGIVKAN